MKFKVYDTVNNNFANDNYVISQEGVLGKNTKFGFVPLPPNLIPIFSTGKKDKFGTELFYGDYIQSRIGTVVEVIIDKGDVCVKDSDDDINFLASKNVYVRIGSKYEEQ